MTSDNRRCSAPCDRRRGHRSGRERGSRAGSGRRAAGNSGVPRYLGRAPAAAGLAGRVRAGGPGRRGRHRLLRRGTGPSPAGGRDSRGRGGPAGPASPGPLDAIEAARAALSGRASGAARTRDGNVEAIRALVVAGRSARPAKIMTLNQIRHLSFTGPEELRVRLKGVSRHQLAALRPAIPHRRHTIASRPEPGKLQRRA